MQSNVNCLQTTDKVMQAMAVRKQWELKSWVPKQIALASHAEPYFLTAVPLKEYSLTFKFPSYHP